MAGILISNFLFHLHSLLFSEHSRGQCRVFFFYLFISEFCISGTKKRDVGPGLESVWLLLEAGKAPGAKKDKIIFSSFLGFTSWHFNKNITVWETLKHLNFWQQKPIVKILKGWVAKHFNRGELLQCQPFLRLGWQVSPHQS